MDCETIVSTVHSCGAPLSAAKLQQLKLIQISEQPNAVYSYQPLLLSGPPIRVYHLVFANFLHCMNNSYEPSYKELDWANGFVTTCSAYYKTKALCKRAMKDMKVAVHRNILMTIDLLCYELVELDGVARVLGLTCGFCPVMIIHKVRNEIGEGNCNPIAHTECCYIAIYSSNEVSTRHASQLYSSPLYFPVRRPARSVRFLPVHAS